MVKRALIRSLSDIDIRLIRVFITVTECGGFAASELELNIGRSTISKHIADLETRIGLKLCKRGPAGFALTAEGERFLVAARRLLGSIHGFQSEVNNIHSKLTGTLRIGIFDQSTTNPNAHIDKAIREFDGIAPDVILEIALDPPGALEAQVTGGNLDLAIVPIHRRSSSLAYTPLYTEQMTLYCGKDHPLFDAPGDRTATAMGLENYKYAGYAFNSPNLKAGKSLGIKRAARVEEEEALSLLVQSGRYLGYLADHVAKPFVDTGKMRPIAPTHTSYSSTFAAITRRQPEHDRKAQEFITCLERHHPKP